jgi:TonB family protein
VAKLPSLGRAAVRLAGCPFPAEADAKAIDEGRAKVEVVVSAAGVPSQARVLEETPGGFGAAAVGCVLATRFVPAEDAAGNPVQASVPVNIRFLREPPR